MKSIVSFIVLVIVGSLSSAWAQESPLTLADCYALTLKQSEKIGIQQELITEAEGRFARALGAVLPQLSFSSSDKRQDGSGGSAFTLKEVPERKFVLSQTLFGGFKEAAAMAIARKEKRQRLHEKERVEQLLLLDVANAFYLLFEQRADLKILVRSRKTLVKRMTELKERERLGRSRPSELASTEADLRRIEAEEERIRSGERVVRQLLEFLTGREIGEIVDTGPPVISLEPEEHYLEKATLRSDVRAFEEAWEVSKKQLTIARAPLWPSVEVEGNYYTERAGAAEGVDWDATLTVDVPIFEGGQAFGAVKEVGARSRAAELRFAEAKRIASLDIREAYVSLQAALARRSALHKALAASEEDYRLQVEDYRLNLVSNLDVLETLEDLERAERDFLHVSFEAKRLYWQLRVASGETL